MLKSACITLLTSASVVGATMATRGPSRPVVDHDDVVEIDLFLEMNAADDDAEVVLEVAAEEAIDRLIVFDPHFHPILRLASDDGEDLGLAEVLLESAEPSVDEVLEAYPEGDYFGFVRTTKGEWHLVEAELTHDLPDEPVILFPRPDQTVRTKGTVVTWEANDAVEEWIVEIENDDLERALTVELPGDVTSFAIPDGFLVSGEDFELGLGAEADDNLIVVEQEFHVE